MGELLGALGLAWPRLLLYPGGLFAVGAAWLLGRWLKLCLERGARGGGEGERGRGGGEGHGGLFGRLVTVVPPLAALSLLPLAPARAFPYGLDLVIALALLEAPRLWPLPEVAEGSERARIGRDGLIRDYLPLIVAAAAMAEAVGGLELTRLLRLPGGWLERALLGAGALLWLGALPRLIARGPRGWPGLLRALGLLSVAALPLLAALAAAEPLSGEVAGWVLPPTALLVAGLLLGALTRLGEQARHGAAVALGALSLALLALRELVERAG